MCTYPMNDREGKAFDALIVAAIWSSSSDEMEQDPSLDVQALTESDRQRFESLPADFVRTIIEGSGWVSPTVNSQENRER